MAKRNLYLYVDNLRSELGINENHYPINAIEICKEKNIFVGFKKFNNDQFCALAFKGERNDTIILNSARGKLENQFDCGHELLHLTKHRESKYNYFNCFTKANPKQNSFLEWEANEGSAELLVPYKLLLLEISKAHSSLSSWHAIRKLKFDLAKRFNVSEAVIQYRFESLKYEIHQHIHGADIEKIDILSANQQCLHGIKSSSLNTTESDFFNQELRKWQEKNVDINIYKT